ncbi:MAG: SpoIIE family protein phosphatase, partial [Oscillatoriales cyanobacterium SM2_2_1]|nr:SpoIIE family protein phosphatase [Oscillatoriales cyanobacterium SM2_2_1]
MDSHQTPEPILKPEYLWAVNLPSTATSPGSLLCDRYRLIHSQVVEDTQPLDLPYAPDEFSPLTVAYLRLSRLPLHLPRPYGLLRLEQQDEPVILLENAPLDGAGHLYPPLADVWKTVGPRRQLHYLWQLLHLWQPLAEQQVLQTLLEPQQVRVHGPWVRLLEIRAEAEPVTLALLGDYLLEWRDHAHETIAEVAAEFFYTLSRGTFDPPGAIAFLDHQLSQQGRTMPLTIRVATSTDVGLRRDHNEDACYPYPHRQRRSQQGDLLRDRLAIVCDGLGGHEGGEIASGLAIKTLEQQVQILLRQIQNDRDSFSPRSFGDQLAAIVRVVNNQLVALNDQQQRQAQQRMGTTLVMAVIPNPQGETERQVFVVSVGDSRVYLCTPDRPYQITLDDDVATREATLGYNLYAYASKRYDGGALIQALGTRSSDQLQPRVHRFIIDEDCLLLLCSDGLSDFERVSQIYDAHIRPVLTEHRPLYASCQNLIEQANKLNGHDNITVALMRFTCAPPTTADDQDESSLPTEDTTLQLDAATILQDAFGATEPPLPEEEPPDLDDDASALVLSSKEPLVASDHPESNPIVLWAILLVLVIAGGWMFSTRFFVRSPTLPTPP